MKVKITTLPMGHHLALMGADNSPIFDLRPIQGDGNPEFADKDGRDPKVQAYYAKSSPSNLVEAIKAAALMLGGIGIGDTRGVRRSVAMAMMVKEKLEAEGHQVEVRHLALGDKPFNLAALMAKAEGDTSPGSPAQLTGGHGDVNEKPEAVEFKAKDWAELGISDPDEVEDDGPENPNLDMQVEPGD